VPVKVATVQAADELDYASLYGEADPVVADTKAV